MWDPGRTDQNRDQKAVVQLYCAKIKRKKRKEHQKKARLSICQTHSHTHFPKREQHLVLKVLIHVKSQSRASGCRGTKTTVRSIMAVRSAQKQWVESFMDWTGLPRLSSCISPYISAVKGTPGVRAVERSLWRDGPCFSILQSDWWVWAWRLPWEQRLPDCMVPSLVEIVFHGWPFRSSEENPTTEMASLVSRTRHGRTTALWAF